MTVHELITELEAMRPIALAEKEWATFKEFAMSILTDKMDAAIAELKGDADTVIGANTSLAAANTKLVAEATDLTSQLATAVADNAKIEASVTELQAIVASLKAAAPAA